MEFGLFTEFEYDGTYFHFRDVCIMPKPHQKPHPPICMAASTEETYPLVGRMGLPIFVAPRTISILGLGADMEPVLRLMQKYADVPMSLADACLVRMTEALPDPLLLTTDTAFRAYRRHSRQAVPCALPD
jgi:hypothetical protein